jgi:hypothetical protein
VNAGPERRDDNTPALWERLVLAVCLLAIVAGALVFASHAVAYFFLFDDFALNGQASRWPIGDILGTPLFGFYRPAVFLVVRAEHAIFGWQHPSGYMVVALALHAANAALVGLLTRRVAGATLAGVVAGTLFWLSPWAGEAIFWMSGLFDVLSTTGVLVALVAALAAADREARASVPIAVAAAAALVACFAKESAIVVGALFLIVWLGGRPADRGWRRPLIVTAVLGAIGAASLVGRTLVLRSVDAGAYGGWWSLVSSAHLPTNLRLFATALVSLPAPHDGLMRPVGVMRLLAPLLPIALGAVVGAAALRRGRVTLAAVAAMLVALLPVVWVLLRLPGSAGGRVLYLPGAFLCLTIGAGVRSLLDLRPTASRVVALAVAAVLLVQSAASVRAQEEIWAASARLSRQAIEAFRPYVGRTDPIHVANLPFWFEEGPYVLKSYAFGYYYHPAATPPVSATALSLMFSGGDARVTMRQAEPGVASAPSGGAPVELAIGLR